MGVGYWVLEAGPAGCGCDMGNGWQRTHNTQHTIDSADHTQCCKKGGVGLCSHGVLYPISPLSMLLWGDVNPIKWEIAEEKGPGRVSVGTAVAGDPEPTSPVRRAARVPNGQRQPCLCQLARSAGIYSVDIPVRGGHRSGLATGAVGQRFTPSMDFPPRGICKVLKC